MLAHRLDIEKRQVSVEPLHLAPDRGDHALGFDARVDDERQVTVILARQGEVYKWLRVFAQCPVLAVFHDADDLKARVVRAALAQSFADWSLSQPEASREGFIDDHEARFILVIPHSEIASLEQRNAHRLEITRPDESV